MKLKDSSGWFAAGPEAIVCEHLDGRLSIVFAGAHRSAIYTADGAPSPPLVPRAARLLSRFEDIGRRLAIQGRSEAPGKAAMFLSSFEMFQKCLQKWLDWHPRLTYSFA